MKNSVKFTLSFLCAATLFTSCTSFSEKKQSRKEIVHHKNNSQFYNSVFEERAKNKEKLNNYVKNMPLEKRVAQLFIENLEGNSSFRSYETLGDIASNNDSTPLIAGGYLFFSYNLSDTAAQTNQFISSIRSYTSECNQLQPFLAIDQEGGFVNRLKKLTGGLPSQEKVAADYSVSAAYELYSAQSVSMHNIGFNMNLSPVVEICTENNKDFLMGRSFGNKSQTTRYSFACINGYENNGIGSVIKHFPGNTNTDPHTGLPEITLSYEELFASLEPFKRVVQLQPSGVLMSHARTSAVDDGVPACLSKVWVTDILRNSFGYEGIIFSDDIFMGALNKNGYPPETAAIMAVEAGINCIMTSEKRFAKQGKVLYQKALSDKAFEEKINASVVKILEYKIDAGLFSLEDLK